MGINSWKKNIKSFCEQICLRNYDYVPHGIERRGQTGAREREEDRSRWGTKNRPASLSFLCESLSWYRSCLDIRIYRKITTITASKTKQNVINFAIFEFWERNKNNNTYKKENILNSLTLISWKLPLSLPVPLCLPHAPCLLFKSCAFNCVQRAISTCQYCLWEKRQVKRRTFCCSCNIKNCAQLLQICSKGNIWKESSPLIKSLPFKCKYTSFLIAFLSLFLNPQLITKIIIIIIK